MCHEVIIGVRDRCGGMVEQSFFEHERLEPKWERGTEECWVVFFCCWTRDDRQFLIIVFFPLFSRDGNSSIVPGIFKSSAVSCYKKTTSFFFVEDT